MRFSRARYVTLCQQSLVTAAVLAVGVSAAGVKTLDIVPQPDNFAGARGPAPVTPEAAKQNALTKRVVDSEPQPRSRVDVEPVTPRVREVRVSGISKTVAGSRVDNPAGRQVQAPKATTAPSATPTPEKQAPTTPAKQADEQAPADKQLVALSDPEPVRGYATVGVTWKHGVELDEDTIAVQVRTEKNGTWSEWTDAAYHDEHGPDDGSAEVAGAKERPGTDALVIGDVDRVQMRAETTDGSVPADLKLAVVAPGKGTMTDAAPAIDTSTLSAPATEAPPEGTAPSGQASDETSGGEPDTVALSAMRAAPKPTIYSRAQWGANERLREQSSPQYGTVKAGFVHHTVNANNYTAEQVPALLRGIYAYHTQSRGWRDIGYNFLVDRFGRIWEGRWGGVDRAVVGAHTSGYNEVSFAMSAIGNFDIADSPQVVSDAYARLFAWKLSMYGIRADASRVYVKNKYMQAISGHRDAGSTACPGRYLYAKLPAIRLATQRLQDIAQTSAPAPAVPAPLAPAAPPAPVVPAAPPAAPKPAGPAYTGNTRGDAKCTGASVNMRAYRTSGATTRVHLTAPLQCLLKGQGFYRYAVTGKWNAQTVTALRAFQARVRHPVQSLVSRSDWVSLLSAGNSGRALSRGARSTDVVRLQRALNAALGRNLSVNGFYGARTRKAVGSYQRRVGIKPTKVVASQTWAALRAGKM